ncbi:MAG: DUF6642 family protein [Nonlabens sp.]
MNFLQSTAAHQDNFIYCLEVVPDEETAIITPVVTILEHMARQQQINSIYQTCDTIEGLEDSLSSLLHDDHNFKDYEIIYLVVPGEANSVLINGYYYSIEELAELFEGKMEGKIIHFANKKVLDLSQDEFQYFLDVTGARAISGYGAPCHAMTSAYTIDRVFFTLFYENDDLKETVERMFHKHYDLCKLLDFRLYY